MPIFVDLLAVNQESKDNNFHSMCGFSSGAVQQDPVKQELGKLKCYLDTVTNICKTTIITQVCRPNLPSKDVLASIYRLFGQPCGNKPQETLDASKVRAFL